jgi:hypothetical protein
MFGTVGKVIFFPTVIFTEIKVVWPIGGISPRANLFQTFLAGNISKKEFIIHAREEPLRQE